MFGTKSKEIARLKQTIDDQRSELEILRRSQESWNKSVREQDTYWGILYKELNDRYTLLDSLLKQLHINITLPVKKNAGRG